MSFNLVPPTLTKVFDPTAGCTNFIALEGPSTLSQDLAFRPSSTSLSINRVPITISQPRVPRPESQEDWDAKKHVIRRLYLDENLPLREIIDVMSKEHSFAATERMYKRQFQQWNWKKYNTKAHQRSRAQGVLVETCRGVAKCRRPARRHLSHALIQDDSVHHLVRRLNNNFAQSTPGPTGALLYGNRLYEWTEKTYVNIREIILDTARRDLSWSQSSRHQLFCTHGPFARSYFDLAFNLFAMGDIKTCGPILRQAFREVEKTIETRPEPVKFFEELLVRIPGLMCERRMYKRERGEILQRYLRHLSRLLDTTYTGRPVSLAAAAMQQLFSIETGRIDHDTLQLKSIQIVVADCYLEIRGESDLSSIMARVQTIFTSSNADRIKYTEKLRSSLKDLIQTTVDTFGENSHEYRQLVRVSLSLDSRLNSPGEETRAICEKGISQLAATNSASLEDWSIFALLLLSSYNSTMAETLVAENKRLAISHLLESLSACKIARRKSKEGEIRRYLAGHMMQTRIRLINELILLGKVREAAEQRVGLVKCDFLREMQEKDLLEMGSGGLS